MPKSHTPPPRRKKPISMHEDVPVWADCCSCEAEPYWQALADEQEEHKAEHASEEARHD
jgi:hypothetical protein